MQTQSGLPQHVAFILDGNGRWAEQRGLPRLEGHRAGVQNVRRIINALLDARIPYATFYIFSTENWQRPRKEVSGLMSLVREALRKETSYLHQNNIITHHLGAREGLSKSLCNAVDKMTSLTAKNHGMHIGIAFNYGGRREIIDAARRMINDGLKPEDITEETFANYLYSKDFPDVDLVIRTGGEYRTSNFLIWQSIYAEYYFTPVLWPDFDEKHLAEALKEFTKRRRRFGRIPPGSQC